MSIQRIGFKHFVTFTGETVEKRMSTTEPFTSVMRTVTDGNPSTEEIKTLAAYLQWRINASLMRLGGNEYGTSWLPTGFGYPETKWRDGYRAQPASLPDGSLSGIVAHAASTHRVDPDLISAVIRAESGGNPRATSPKGAMGLMQLMPSTAKDLGVTEPYDPRQNVMAGTKYLKTLLDRYNGNRDLALAAYNWGMGNLEKSHRSMPQETVEYVARIKKYLGGKA